MGQDGHDRGEHDGGHAVHGHAVHGQAMHGRAADGDVTHDHGGCGHRHGGGMGHVHAPASFGGAFAIGIALNVAYVGGEVVYGLLAHSLALLADAGHNAGDVLGLAAAWLADRLGRARPTRRFTYGFRASSILAALGNAVILLVITGGIAAEAIRRLFEPSPTAGLTVMAVAAVGIAVNGATALMFMRGRERDLNRAAAFAHMAADAGVAAAVVVAGLAIHLTGWSAIDPVVSLLVSVLIVRGTWSLLRRSVFYALDAVPPGVDREAVERLLRGAPGVVAVHDLHIWGMSTTETALTAHLVCPDRPLGDAGLAALCAALQRQHDIAHATLQVEQGDAAHPCALAPAEVV